MNKYNVNIKWLEDVEVEADSIEDAIEKVCGDDNLFMEFYRRLIVEEIEEQK